ncbi:type II toxin-antitoxin system VapC family toxin [Novosphingobium album (ex Liu et al. 2023)]|uniref:Ribonuclease VapC n=1 Tax=Novosphingobium album (ex Liu et al. 2023) TaxID=3031130 RepID=A0ABT5WLJ3_9SPHN|nr:type II toxin-antitoxin system VapC family toxin [Novosphingobium album (ex Liu et al. 2023)]MDE8650916.1 type II toxin-antitoxin system VapC family toxin [Novosphingobium album (ex Liu et al. 2023)]
MSHYLDASVLVALLTDELASEKAARFVGEARQPLYVSDFARGEVASAISRLVRMGGLDAADAGERLTAFEEWCATAARPLATEAADIRLAALLVARFALALRMPDAIHLAAAQARSMTLVTLDQRMAEKAAALGIAVVVPD